MEEKQLKEWLARILDRLRWLPDSLTDVAASAASEDAEGWRFRVDEVAPGEFAVLREGREGSAPYQVCADRKEAYLLAAALTALGPPLGPGSGTTEPVDEVREPGEAYRVAEDPLEARVLEALLRNPAALELLLQAADTEVLEEAQALAALRQPKDKVN